MAPVLRPRYTAPVLRPPVEASCEVVSGATLKQFVLRAPCGEELIARALPSDASVGLEAGDGAELRQGEGDADSAVDAPQDQGGYANHYLAVLPLQRDLPGLQMDVRPNLKGEYVLTHKDDASTDRMCGLAQERDAPARLVLLDPAERHTKAVLQRYPLEMPFEAVWDHPSVISAGRLRAVRNRAPTRQVLGAVNTPSGVAFAARRTHPSSASGVIRPGSSRPPDAPTASGGTTPGTPAAPNACDDCLEEGGAYRAAVMGRGRKVPLFLLRFQRGRNGGVQGHLAPTPRGRGD
ncbi:hypothetical protein GWK47_040633 [Chionoecetes opilio]|uniref:Uncharacterized protein n=1 Tax=Chionoecetes opilio TaxID=41210 RepID=A0A8J4YAI6_CHIOP|nr:hypothetical protein GWK47_040633 [Chionoecetes opilio]